MLRRDSSLELLRRLHCTAEREPLQSRLVVAAGRAAAVSALRLRRSESEAGHARAALERNNDAGRCGRR